MLVEHASPRCGSRQFYNGILDGHAHGVFHGRIIVHKDAQKTDAKQTNRNLLLSDDAQIDTKPQLEIYADDVKCTHGATMARSRGRPVLSALSRHRRGVRAQALALRLRQRVPRPHEAGTGPQARRRADQPLSVPDGQLCRWRVDRDPSRRHRKKLGGNRMTTAAKRLPRESRPADVHDAGGDFDVRKLRRDFPILRQRVRQDAGLPGQCSHVPEAAGGH
jgi:ABC-type transport system involved in Fe-S cluster assembly, permease component